MIKGRVLIIDDEEIVRVSCHRILAPEGYEVKSAKSAADGFAMLQEGPVDIVLTDLKMPEMDGIEVLKSINNQWPDIEVIMITGYQAITAAITTAAEAIRKLGAFDYACGILSGLALALWYVTKDPNVAISFAIASDGLASAPTFVKAWRYPETESPWPYVVGTFNALTSFVAITLWTFSAYAFPAYLTIISVLLCLAVFNQKLVIPFSKATKVRRI